MQENKFIEELTNKISSSKNYKNIYKKTIERIVKNCIEKYPKKQLEKKAKTLLHQIWGAYYKSKPNFEKILNKFKEDIKVKDLKQSLLPILSLQSSTRERISILEDFYKQIFDYTGYPNTMIDHACGLNPLTIFWMNLPENTIYKAYDIDKEQIDFLNQLFKLTKPQNKIEINPGDILLDKFEYADVVFMLKLLPPLEHQQKGISLEILKKQKAKYIVVSFPIKSLGGTNKGMLNFYQNWFENLIKNEDWKYKKIIFETELAYVVKKEKLIPTIKNSFK